MQREKIKKNNYLSNSFLMKADKKFYFYRLFHDWFLAKKGLAFNSLTRMIISYIINRTRGARKRKARRAAYRHKAH